MHYGSRLQVILIFFFAFYRYGLLTIFTNFAAIVAKGIRIFRLTLCVLLRVQHLCYFKILTSVFAVFPSGLSLLDAH